MLIREIICPYCNAKFTPYSVFMIEKCFCPVCTKHFYVLKGAPFLRFLYSLATFTALLTLYNIIRPQTSVIIAVFWIGAMLILKIITYVTHYFLLVTYSAWQYLRKR